MTSSFINYEMMINIKSLDIINLRQSGFYQIRFTVYQTNNKQNNTFAIPFLMLKSDIEKQKSPKMLYQSSNASEIDYSNNTFLTSKFIVRNIDTKTEINEICIFKGTLLYYQPRNLNKQIKVYAELLNYQQSDVEVVTQWEGSTLNYMGCSYCPIYFNSYKFTCNLNSTFHCIISSISLDHLVQRSLKEVEQLGNCGFYEKYRHFIEQSMNQLKAQYSLFSTQKQMSKNYRLQSQSFNDKIEEYRLKCFDLQDIDTNQKISDAILKEKMTKMPPQQFLQTFKQSIYLLNQVIYDSWKKMQLILMNKYNKKAQDLLKEKYQRELMDYHKETIILTEQDQKPVKPNRQSKLFIYPFQIHETCLKIKKHQIESFFSTKVNNNKKQLIIFVHGYQASSFDMEPLSNYLKYKNPNIISLLSTVNEGRTQQQIEESAHRLAIEIKNYINSLQLKDFQISFICHSLGGIIGRACLKYLQLHKDRFNHFVSLCSPHLGYLYHSSTLISTSLWILNKVKKDASMLQLTMEDNQQLHETYLYKLSHAKELCWFNKIWLFGSKEDQYVPYWSAILQEKYFFFETQASKIYKTMLESLNKDIQHKINRIELIFNEKAKDLSNFIGRTAHIKMLNYIPGIELFSELFVL